MCGRYTVGDIETVARALDTSLPAHFQPRYNAAPSQSLPVVSNTQRRQLALYSWGIVPFWAREQDSKRLINARAETVREKSTFKKAFQRQRCLVPASGYYEWKKTAQGKVPYHIVLKDRSPFVFAGLWSTHTGEGGEEVRDFCIITTAAAENIAHIHDRMPVILDPEGWDFWLSDTEDEEGLQDMLRPLETGRLQAYTVSKRVNNVQNDDETLIEEVRAG